MRSELGEERREMSETNGYVEPSRDAGSGAHPRCSGDPSPSRPREGAKVVGSQLSRIATGRAEAPRSDGSRRESASTRAAARLDESPLILVVDDFEDNRDLYSAYLSLSGYRVIEAEDGLDAVEKATAEVPDLIVMDLAMPRMDGWEAIEVLRGDGRTRDIPVVVLTGSGAAAQPRATSLGCASFLMKPCMPQDLVRVVRAHVPTRPALTPPPRGDDQDGRRNGSS